MLTRGKQKHWLNQLRAASILIDQLYLKNTPYWTGPCHEQPCLFTRYLLLYDSLCDIDLTFLLFLIMSSHNTALHACTSDIPYMKFASSPPGRATVAMESFCGPVVPSSVRHPVSSSPQLLIRMTNQRIDSARDSALVTIAIDASNSSFTGRLRGQPTGCWIPLLSRYLRAPQPPEFRKCMRFKSSTAKEGGARTGRRAPSSPSGTTRLDGIRLGAMAEWS